MMSKPPYVRLTFIYTASLFIETQNPKPSGRHSSDPSAFSNRPWHSRGVGLSSRVDEGRFKGRAPVNDKQKKELKNEIAQR
jgi:hypothetical protein